MTRPKGSRKQVALAGGAASIVVGGLTLSVTAAQTAEWFGVLRENALLLAIMGILGAAYMFIRDLTGQRDDLVSAANEARDDRRKCETDLEKLRTLLLVLLRDHLRAEDMPTEAAFRRGDFDAEDLAAKIATRRPARKVPSKSRRRSADP